MSSKKPTLSQALHKLDTRPKNPAQAEEEPPIEAPVMSASISTKPPSRRGKKTIAGHFDPAVSVQIKQLALERGGTVQALLAEALNDLFIKYNKPHIA